jgi:hypothetical protein
MTMSLTFTTIRTPYLIFSMYILNKDLQAASHNLDMSKENFLNVHTLEQNWPIKTIQIYQHHFHSYMYNKYTINTQHNISNNFIPLHIHFKSLTPQNSITKLSKITHFTKDCNVCI